MVKSAALQYVGRTFPVTDAVRKATGTLEYGSDLKLPGMLHVALVLSPHAHASVVDVDATSALAVAGAVGVFSHLNSPTTPFNRYRIVPGQTDCIADETLFASTARFAGDRVAAVVATSLAAARRAATLVKVTYAPLPAVFSPAAAMADDALPLHPGGNMISEFDHTDGVAPHPPGGSVVTTTVVSTQRLHHAAIEPHTCTAHFDRAGKLTIWSTCQSVYGARTVVADLLDLPYNRVRVVKSPMGGSFGGKQEFILEPLVAYLATQVDHPVQLTLDREECIAATMTRPAQESTITTTVAPDGQLLDMDVQTVLDAGAYATSSPGYAAAMAHKLARLYRIPHYRHRGTVVYTNTPIAGGYRGWGAPDIMTCGEIHLDQVAKQAGLDPVVLRMRNLVEPGDIDPIGNYHLGDARVRECLQLGAEAFGWHQRVTLPPGSGRYRRGVGVACGGHKNGILSNDFPETSTMTLKMNEDGSLNLGATIHEVGGGAVVTMRIIVAEVLGVDPSLISAGEADSEVTPFDFGCYGSRVTYVCGASAYAVAVAMQQRLMAAAALLLAEPQESLCAVPGRIELAGRPGSGLSFLEIAHRTRMERAQDIVVTNTYIGLSNPGSYSVQFAEVEADLLTGLVRVTDFLAVVDIGRAINRGMVEGQVRGGVQAGIGSALCEEVVLDREGRVAPGGFKNYHIFNAADMPDVRVLLVEHDGDDGPFGAKSVGEIATVPTAAAVVNAANRALGTAITTLPLTPERVVAALNALPADAVARATCVEEEATCC